MTDAAASYFAALAAIRLRALLTGARWPVEEDTFDLVLAAAMQKTVVRERRTNPEETTT